MTTKQRIFAAATAFVAAACMSTGAFAAAISGAIFTSDVDGNVNVNHYPAKTDVYLNGGPQNANCDAAAIEDGTYVFQVTNPNGNVVLSSDDISQREFTVSGGVIQSANSHVTSVVDPPCAGVRVQLYPFDDTPNNGGVYKAWITRKSDYIANGNQFRNNDSKTDNFHVDQPSEVPELADLNVYKFYDKNGNGAWDQDEPPLFGWAMTAANGNGFNATQLTESPDGITTFFDLEPGDSPYQVTEGTGGGTWVQSASIIDGTSTPTPANPVTGLMLVAGMTTNVIFGNYCLCKSGGKPKSWWITDTAKTKVNDGGTMNPEFNALNQLNLRASSGSHWNLNTTTVSQATNWNSLKTFISGTSTTNMAYALSRQLAIARLNTDAGFMLTGNFYAPYGGTIAELMADANAALGIDGNTPVGDPNRALQSDLTNWLLAVNNNATVINGKPCKYYFPDPTVPTVPTAAP